MLKTFGALLNNTNSEGANPYAGLTLVGNALYGTTKHGGNFGVGTLFKINFDGTGYTVLKSFSGSGNYGTAGYGGPGPYGGLTLSDNVLYGTASGGVSGVFGTVFSLTLSGTLNPNYNKVFGQLLSNSNMRLSFSGIAGTNYAVDHSASLSSANWIPQTTNFADANGNLVFTNTPDPTTNNFWRIRTVP